MRAASNPVRLGKYSLGKIFFIICKYVLLIFAAFCALVPLVSCVITAFKTVDEYNNTNVMTLPESWLYFDNFVTAWKQANMGKAFLNSFLVLLFVLLGSTLFSAMLAYVLNRFQFRGNKLIRNLFMISTLIPGIATQVTIYQIMYTLGLVNTLYGYIILMLGTDVISIYIFLQYFDNLPKTLDEAAILDGCTYVGVFFKILLPLLKPATCTCNLVFVVGSNALQRILHGKPVLAGQKSLSSGFHLSVYLYRTDGKPI